jgi:SSS family transporter
MKSAILSALWLLAVAHCPAAAEEPPREILRWESLPDLPDPLGLGGPFAGVSGGALIVAGGANFPTPLFEGGKKVWTDAIFTLDPKTKKWLGLTRLARPLAYGASITWKDDLLCIGGCDATRCYAEVLRASQLGAQFTEANLPLPPLPKPCAMMGAALIGDTIYVAGGQETPTATEALRNLWALDLSKPPRTREWAKLEPWPGPSRILPVVVAQSNGYETQVYVISGAELSPGPDGKAVRRYLTDGYAYSPKSRAWRRIADVPRPVVAAPAIALGQAHVLVFGGDDGANATRIQELKDRHPGFSRDLLAYHTITNTWTKMGTLPLGLATTNAVKWQDGIVIPSGEDRPGHRSPKILFAQPKKHQASFGAINYAVLAAYLLAMVLVGFYFSKREKTTDDFFLAGHRVPWWAAGLSIYATQLSAITFMSIPATVYATNWLPFLSNVCIVLVAPIVVFLYLPFFRRLNVTTAYEYLEKRFNLSVRLASSVLFIVYQIGRMGIVVLLPAIALSATAGIDIYLSVALMGVLCTVYTVLGGIEAVIWTDVLQTVVLLGGAVAALVVIAGNVEGGLPGVFSVAAADAKLRVCHWSWDYTAMAVWVVVLGNLLSNLIPYTADQAVVQRYLTTRDERAAARGIWINTALILPGTLIFFTIGAALYAYYKSTPAALEPTLENDYILPLFIAQKLPVGLAGLIVAGIFAASMSTLDSSMNSVATALVTDFYRRFRPEAPDGTCLRLARWLTLLLGALGTGTALFLASVDIRSLWFTFVKILGLVGGGLAGVFILGIFTRRATGAGALVGIVAGAILSLFAWLFTPVHFYLYAAIGIAGCFLVGYLASLISPAPTRSLDGLTIFTIPKEGTRDA